MKTLAATRKCDGHDTQAQDLLELTQKDSICKMRTQDAEKARKRVRKAPEGVLTVDDVAVIAGEKLTITVGLPNVLKLKFHSHHQMERVDGSRAGR